MSWGIVHFYKCSNIINVVVSQLISIIGFEYWNKWMEAVSVFENLRDQTFVVISCNFSEVIHLGSQPPPMCLAKHSIDSRRMCGVSLKDRKRSDELLNRLGIECVENKIQRGRLRWFGHVERKEENNWVKKCTRMNVIGVVNRGAPRKTWRSCVKRDMKAMGIKEEMAQDRCAWRNITGGPTRASADAWNTVCVLGSRTLNEYDDDDDLLIS